MTSGPCPLPHCRFCGECLQPCLQVPSPLCPLCRLPFDPKKVDKAAQVEKQLSSYKAPCRGCNKKVPHPKGLPGSRRGLFLKKFYLFLESREGWEREMERNIDVCEINTDWSPFTHTPARDWAPKPTCALTGNRTGDLSLCKTILSQLSHTSQGQKRVLSAWGPGSALQQRAGLFPFLLRTLQLCSAPPAQHEAFLDGPTSCPMLHPLHPTPLHFLAWALGCLYAL